MIKKHIFVTFTKPAVGMLDFASGAATVVRDSSRKATYSSSGGPSLSDTVAQDADHRWPTDHLRCDPGHMPGGTWQARFYSSSDFGAREYGEQFVHVFLLADRHFLLLTIERLFFFHSTLKRSDLPESNADLLLLEEHLEFPEHFGAKIRSCSILQLQALALEQSTMLSRCVSTLDIFTRMCGATLWNRATVARLRCHAIFRLVLVRRTSSTSSGTT